MVSRRLWIPIGFCVVGICFAHHPMLLSGLRRVQIDHEDPRLINYLLEHGYQWLAGNPLHSQLWSPPFFYPVRDALAFSDTLLSAGPLYWAVRLVGLHPDTAFQIWMMTCFIIDYLAFYLLLRSRLHLREFPAAMGAFLFAYGAPRVADIGHPQLLPQFFSILAILAMLWLLDGSRRSLGHRVAGWTLVQLAIVAQLYASFYLGWFLVLSLLLAFLLALTSPAFRPGLLRTLDRDLVVIGITSIIPTILILPLLGRYLEVAWVSGYRSPLEVSLAAPRLRSWIYSGPDSWLYGWMPKHGWFLGFGSLEPAHRIGVGLLTPLLCIAGLWLRRPGVIAQVVAMTGLALFLLVTLIPRTIIVCLALSLLVVCTGALWRQRGEPKAMLPPAILCALLGYSLFPPSSLWLACRIAVVGIVAGLALRSMRSILLSLDRAISPGVSLARLFPGPAARPGMGGRERSGPPGHAGPTKSLGHFACVLRLGRGDRGLSHVFFWGPRRVEIRLCPCSRSRGDTRLGPGGLGASGSPVHRVCAVLGVVRFDEGLEICRSSGNLLPARARVDYHDIRQARSPPAC